MANASQARTVVGTFEDVTSADLACDAARGAGFRVELVEKDLRTRTRPVQTGEVTIRREVVSESRTIEVPIRREDLVIERHRVVRQPLDAADTGASDPLVAQLMHRLGRIEPGEVLRIRVVEEDVIVHKRPS